MEFVKRVKERFWPDWNKICETLALNPEDVKEEVEPVIAPEAAPPAAEIVATTTVVTTTETVAQEGWVPAERERRDGSTKEGEPQSSFPRIFDDRFLQFNF